MGRSAKSVKPNVRRKSLAKSDKDASLSSSLVVKSDSQGLTLSPAGSKVELMNIDGDDFSVSSLVEDGSVSISRDKNKKFVAMVFHDLSMEQIDDGDTSSHERYQEQKEQHLEDPKVLQRSVPENEVYSSSFEYLVLQLIDRDLILAIANDNPVGDPPGSCEGIKEKPVCVNLELESVVNPSISPPFLTPSIFPSNLDPSISPPFLTPSISPSNLDPSVSPSILGPSSSSHMVGSVSGNDIKEQDTLSQLVASINRVKAKILSLNGNPKYVDTVKVLNKKLRWYENKYD